MFARRRVVADADRAAGASSIAEIGMAAVAAAADGTELMASTSAPQHSGASSSTSRTRRARQRLGDGAKVAEATVVSTGISSGYR